MQRRPRPVGTSDADRAARWPAQAAAVPAGAERGVQSPPTGCACVLLAAVQACCWEVRTHMAVPCWCACMMAHAGVVGPWERCFGACVPWAGILGLLFCWLVCGRVNPCGGLLVNWSIVWSIGCLRVVRVPCRCGVVGSTSGAPRPARCFRCPCVLVLRRTGIPTRPASAMCHGYVGHALAVAMCKHATHAC